MEPGPGGRLMRKPLSGTRALGFKIGTLVKHPQYRLSSIGGSLKGKISLDAYPTNKRLVDKAEAEDCTRITFTPYRTTWIGEVKVAPKPRKRRKGRVKRPLRVPLQIFQGKH